MVDYVVNSTLASKARDQKQKPNQTKPTNTILKGINPKYKHRETTSGCRALL